jgi:hypothetical protein
MTRDQQLYELARAVTPLAARQYAESKGWKIVPAGYDHGLYLFKHPTESLRQVQIPIQADSTDYPDAIVDAGERLSSHEGRPVIAVLNDLFLVGSDVLRCRVISPHAQTGVISLDGGLNLLQGARQAILAAACTAKNPVRVHPRMTWEEATQMLRATKLGQTEHSSFVVKIACPVEAVDGAQLPDSGEPFVRRATRILMESAGRLVTAIQRNEVETMESATNAVPISANLCEAFARMHAVDESAKLTISATWSGTISPPESITPTKVSLEPDYFPVIEKVAQRLRAIAEPKRDVFVGTVEELRGEFDQIGRRSGEVIVAILHGNELVPASVMLTAEQHALADQAYMTGRKIILKGHFHPRRRLHEVKDVTEFGLLG